MTAQLEFSKDRMFDGALLLRQPRRGHRAGTDAVLLAAACPDGVASLADLGAGSGVVGLRAAQMHPSVRATLFEREAGLVALAAENIGANGLSGRVEAVCADVTALGGDPRWREAFDCVLTNPPFHDPARRRASPDPARAKAHLIDPAREGVDGWLRAVAAVLAPQGNLVMIHAADQIAVIIAAMARRFGDIRLRLVYPDAGSDAIRLLVAARKGSRAPMRILPPLILNDEAGRFLPEVAALHRGLGRIVL